jgi:hypothetical protein
MRTRCPKDAVYDGPIRSLQSPFLAFVKVESTLVFLDSVYILPLMLQEITAKECGHSLGMVYAIKQGDTLLRFLVLAVPGCAKAEIADQFDARCTGELGASLEGLLQNPVGWIPPPSVVQPYPGLEPVRGGHEADNAIRKVDTSGNHLVFSHST